MGQILPLSGDGIFQLAEGEFPAGKPLLQALEGFNGRQRAVTVARPKMMGLPNAVVPAADGSLTGWDAVHPMTKADADYVKALQVQFLDRGKRRVPLSDAELAKRLRQGGGPSSGRGRTEDVYNKVHVVQAAGDAGDDKVLRDKVEALVLASLEKINAEKRTKSANDYLKRLRKEAEVRENETRTVVVKAGDTLSAIAVRAYGNGMEYMKIFRANPTLIKDPNRIYIGQVLRVPL